MSISNAPKIRARPAPTLLAPSWRSRDPTNSRVAAQIFVICCAIEQEAA